MVLSMTPLLELPTNTDARSSSPTRFAGEG